MSKGSAPPVYCPNCGGKIVAREIGAFDGKTQHRRECEDCGRWAHVRTGDTE